MAELQEGKTATKNSKKHTWCICPAIFKLSVNLPKKEVTNSQRNILKFKKKLIFFTTSSPKIWIIIFNLSVWISPPFFPPIIVSPSNWMEIPCRHSPSDRFATSKNPPSVKNRPQPPSRWGFGRGFHVIGHLTKKKCWGLEAQKGQGCGCQIGGFSDSVILLGDDDFTGCFRRTNFWKDMEGFLVGHMTSMDDRMYKTWCPWDTKFSLQRTSASVLPLPARSFFYACMDTAYPHTKSFEHKLYNQSPYVVMTLLVRLFWDMGHLALTVIPYAKTHTKRKMVS